MQPCIQQDNITRMSSQMDYIKETVDELKADVKAMPDTIIDKLTKYGDKEYVSKVEHAGFAMQVKLLFGIFSAVVTAAAVAFFLSK